MSFNKLKIKKYGIRAVLFIIVVYLSNFLDQFFDNLNSALLGKVKIRMPIFINWLISIFDFKIPVYSLLLGVIIVWFIYGIYRKIKLGRNKLRILKATYGKNKYFIDITRELNNMVENNKLKLVLSNSIAGDPIVGTVKEGRIKYKYNGQILDKTYKEKEVIELP